MRRDVLCCFAACFSCIVNHVKLWSWLCGTILLVRYCGCSSVLSATFERACVCTSKAIGSRQAAQTLKPTPPGSLLLPHRRAPHGTQTNSRLVITPGVKHRYIPGCHCAPSPFFSPLLSFSAFFCGSNTTRTTTLCGQAPIDFVGDCSSSSMRSVVHCRNLFTDTRFSCRLAFLLSPFLLTPISTCLRGCLHPLVCSSLSLSLSSQQLLLVLVLGNHRLVSGTIDGTVLERHLSNTSNCT